MSTVIFEEKYCECNDEVLFWCVGEWKPQQLQSTHWYHQGTHAAINQFILFKLLIYCLFHSISQTWFNGGGILNHCWSEGKRHPKRINISSTTTMPTETHFGTKQKIHKYIVSLHGNQKFIMKQLVL